ncbi:hypothetical protein HPP92_023472 [Vanilla planifolia]|uniref:Uncharacterized protein n=1 Tax=Vanilla planifolia TaxID=51239 RepID=A0A835PQ38_VANPL|nr:hypothetical protein HPP92_023767 [Vanilla planifolia]KAG0455684.1 hypothetical protein HPP92_023472 [Vanilla planifolia]
MGNCHLRHSPSWVDDDADDHYAEEDHRTASSTTHTLTAEEDGHPKEKEDAKLETRMRVASTEVRIRISKKQLEELLRRAKVASAAGLSAREAMEGLIDISLARPHHWRPDLHSIQEEKDSDPSHASFL